MPVAVVFSVCSAAHHLLLCVGMTPPWPPILQVANTPGTPRMLSLSHQNCAWVRTCPPSIVCPRQGRVGTRFLWSILPCVSRLASLWYDHGPERIGKSIMCGRLVGVVWWSPWSTALPWLMSCSQLSVSFVWEEALLRPFPLQICPSRWYLERWQILGRHTGAGGRASIRRRSLYRAREGTWGVETVGWAEFCVPPTTVQPPLWTVWMHLSSRYPGIGLCGCMSLCLLGS